MDIDLGTANKVQTQSHRSKQLHILSAVEDLNTLQFIVGVVAQVQYYIDSWLMQLLFIT
jgi:hypothetical protein